MKKAKTLVIAIAVVAALLAGYLAYGIVSRPQPKIVKANLDVVEVLVAKTEIGLGDEVRGSDFAWQPWPKDAAKDGYITKAGQPGAMTDLAGSIARTAFLPGEPIKPQKLIKATDGGVMAAILDPGMRAISTKISEDSAAGGFILPNDRVDVIVTRKQRSSNGRGEQQVSETLFRNVRVLAIGQEIDLKDGKKVATGKTATLALSPSQAETLALNNAVGEISLSLLSLEESQKLKGAKPSDGEDLPKKDRSTGIKVLRYGTWSRTYGLQ